MGWIEGIAAATSGLSILCFALYVLTMTRLLTGRRPKIVPVDRLGRALPPAENPDYRDTEEESEG